MLQLFIGKPLGTGVRQQDTTRVTLKGLGGENKEGPKDSTQDLQRKTNIFTKLQRSQLF